MTVVKRWLAGRTRLAALLVFAGIFVIVGGLADHSRLSADDPASDRVLRPMGPSNQLLWPDDSPLRITGGGGGGAGKDALKRDGGGGAVDREAKPDNGRCSSAPSGR